MFKSRFEWLMCLNVWGITNYEHLMEYGQWTHGQYDGMTSDCHGEYIGQYNGMIWKVWGLTTEPMDVLGDCSATTMRIS